MIKVNRYYLNLYIRTIIEYSLRFLRFKYMWIQWVLPFEVLNVFLTLLAWIYYAQTFGAMSPLLEPYGGDFFSYLLLGMLFNTFFLYSIRAPSLRFLGLIRSQIGMGGMYLSEIDHIRLSGRPISAALIGSMIDGFIIEGLTAFAYLTAGFLLGFKLSATANYPLAALAIMLGVLANLGIGFISASMAVLIGTWRGEDPIVWFFTAMGSVFSGVYFPIEAIPEGLRTIGYLLPQTYALIIARTAVLGQVTQPTLTSLYGLAFCAIALLMAGAWLFAYGLQLIRKKGLAGFD